MTRTDRPLVSVCIPTRDRASYLREAIASVLAQGLDDLEILVFDDASTDDTESVVLDVRDPRIIYRKHPRQLGVTGNRNACLGAARGRYLAWLDDDDAYLRGGLRRQVELLESEPDVALAHGAIDVVDERGRARPRWSAPFDRDTIEAGPSAFAELVLRNYVRAPTAVVRARAQRAAGLYAAALADRAEDWDAWLRLSLEGDVAFSARPIARYRCHEAGASAGRTSSLVWLSTEACVVRRALERAEGRVPGLTGLRRRSRAGLAARGLEAAADALARGRGSVAFRAAHWAARFVPPVAEGLRAAAEHARRGDEHRFHQDTRPARGWIAERLAGTRYGAALRTQLDATDAWSSERALVADRIRRVVPPGAFVAAVDKWDPSLLHEAGRAGWHFPDLALSPEGYPVDDRGAIDHLDAQRARGAEYLVFPRASFWWLEHYRELSRHLDRQHDRVWGDDVCVIYRLLDTREREVA